MPDKKQLIFNVLVIVSLVLSCSALYFTTTKSKNPETNIIEKTPEALRKEKLDSISAMIVSTVAKERIYQNLAINPLATSTEVSNAQINYKTEVVYTLSSIKSLASWDDLKLLDFNMLIQYAKLENTYGDRKTAAKAYEYILKNSKHLIFKNEAIIQLAGIYSDRSSLLYNPEKARDFQKEIINTEKKYPSKDKYEQLARLYEEWAKTEFIQFKDKAYGNKVLDSAFYCIRKLPDYLNYKDSLLTRLNAIYNYHNNILTSKTVDGDYKFYVKNVGEGVAKITTADDHISLRIDYLDGKKLMGQIKGIGNFTDPELMIFDVTLKSFSDKFESFREGTGVIEFKTAPNNILNGTLKEYGKEPISLRLLKKTDEL